MSGFKPANRFINVGRGCVYVEGSQDVISLPISFPEGFIITDLWVLLKDTDTSSDILVYLIRNSPYTNEGEHVISMDDYYDVGGGFVYAISLDTHEIKYEGLNYELHVHLRSGNSKHQLCQAQFVVGRKLPAVFPMALPLINN